MSHVIELEADHESARQIGPWLAEALLNLPHEQRLGEIELAVHELAINIVEHAYAEAPGPSTYSIALAPQPGDGDSLAVKFVDNGQPFEDAPRPEPGVPQVGGYGLFIIEQLASMVTYERIDDANHWTLVFSAHPHPETSTLEQQ